MANCSRYLGDLPRLRIRVYRDKRQKSPPRQKGPNVLGSPGWQWNSFTKCASFGSIAAFPQKSLSLALAIG